MATGVIQTPEVWHMPALADRVTDYSMQLFCKDQPPVQDVGYVTTDRTFRVFLWNGSLQDVVLTGITTNGDPAEGIQTTASPPDLLLTNSALAIDITVTIDGPLEYSALLNFLSTCTFDPVLNIIGTRAPHLSGNVGYLFFPHNWQDGLDESLEWKTDVLIAHDRTEQRIQLRTMPRRTWDLRLLVAGAGRRKLETWLGMRKTRFLFAPVWRDETRITQAIEANESLVFVETEFLEFAIDRWIAVYDAWDHFEIRRITGIEGNFVTVDTPFFSSWPQGTLVAPCRYGLGFEQRRVARFTDEVGDYRIRFEALNESLMPAYQSPDLYRYIVVCPCSPSWVNDCEESWDNKWVRLDNDTGLMEYDIQSEEPVLRREARFVLMGRAAIDLFIRFLFYCSGRLAPFWLPATDRGFELAAPAAMGDRALVIASIGYEYSFSDSPARRHIELETVDGTIIRRMITGVETLPSGEEKLSLDLVLPVNVSAATLNRCCWLELVRLDTDAISLKWFTGDCLELTLPIVVLP